MNEIILATQFFGGDVLGLLERIAIICVVAWGIWELIKWVGVPIPRPIQIILICLLSILIIIWAFQIFAQLT